MLDDRSALASDGITQLERELLIRDFVEAMNLHDTTALTPFLHREIRYHGGGGQDVNGSRAVLGLYDRMMRRFPQFKLKIDHLTFVENAVFVEETVWVSAAQSCAGHTFPAFAAFLIKDFQIVGWNQFYG